MGTIWTAVFAGTITAAGTDTDYLEVQVADDRPAWLRGFRLSQYSEVGDAAEEGIRVSVIILPATFTVGSGTGRTAVTPRAPGRLGTTGMTINANSPTLATTSGTAETYDEIGWNNRNSPLEIWYPDRDYAPKVRQGEGLVIRQQTTLADDMSFCLTAWLEEE